jgi:hypothetical protein
MKAAMPNQAARFLAMRSVIVELALMDSHFGLSKVFNYLAAVSSADAISLASSEEIDDSASI